MVNKQFRLIGAGGVAYFVGMALGVLMGVISFQILTNVTVGMTPAPTGTQKLLLDYTSTFLALAIMCLPASAIYIMSR